jgi:hypothetical protein
MAKVTLKEGAAVQAGYVIVLVDDVIEKARERQEAAGVEAGREG